MLNFPHMLRHMCNRVYQPHRLSLKVRDGVGQTHQIPQNGFNLVQLDTNSITHGMTSFLRVMSSIKNISMQRCRQTSHGYITIDVSRKHRGNTREQIVPCPPFLEFFCGGNCVKNMEKIFRGMNLQETISENRYLKIV